MLKNIEADRASEILFGLPVRLEAETVALCDACGRVLAADVRASIDSPPFDRSPFDGFAFRGEDTLPASKDSPVTLKITEEIPAGRQPTTTVSPGCAAKILTGAPIPEGANATIKYELTAFTHSEVKIFEWVRPGSDIVRAGDDIARGSLVAGKGELVTPPLLGVLASQGVPSVEVFKRPRVTVISTGSELVEVGRPLPPAMIYNSNVFTLAGYLRQTGAEPIDGGIVRDAPDEIAERIEKALCSSDMVVTTGGASVGDYDWAVVSAERLGAKILFWKVNMKPGGAIMAAVKDEKLILGLSGNPGAAVLGLFRIALPYVRKLCGWADAALKPVEVFLKEPFGKPSPKTRLLRGRLEIDGGRALFAENPRQGNGAIFSLLGCDLIAEIEAGSPPLPAGAKVRAYRI